MSAHEIHEICCSSTSPTRGSLTLHSPHRALDVVSHPINISESADLGSAIVTTKYKGAGPFVEQQQPAASTTKSEIQPLMTEHHTKISNTPTTRPSLAQSMIPTFTKVNAIDGSSSISLTSKIQILLIYLFFNLGLTLYNKAVMIMVGRTSNLSGPVWISDINTVPIPVSIDCSACRFRHGRHSDPTISSCLHS